MKLRISSLLILCCLAVSLQAQAPKIVNARLQTRSAAAGLEKEFQALVAAQNDPAWIGYVVPVMNGQSSMCCYNCDNGSCCSGCTLEARSDSQNFTTDSNSTVKLEGRTNFFVMYRVEGHKVGTIRNFSEDCQVDAGGLPVYWLTDVRPAESVALLSLMVMANRSGDREQTRMSDRAVSAIAQHRDPSADAALERFIAADQPEEVRSRTAFWLGVARGKRGYDLLTRMLQNDPSEKVRERVIFGLTQSKEPGALDTVIQAARKDASPHVRGQALFWLAQKAGQKAAGTITDAINNDPETQVKERAVFALSQLPNGQGVPLLIDVAKTNKNPTVRKRAMFWLGQSKDARALDFFEQVLTK